MAFTVKSSDAIAAQNGWDVNTADVSQAYVAASLGVLMYMKPPPEIALTGILKHGQTIAKFLSLRVTNSKPFS